MMTNERQRAEFEAWARRHLGMPEHIAFNWEADWTLAALEGYRAGRAALQTQDREDALEAENMKLREALEMMVEMVEMNGWGRDYAMDVARAALAAMEQKT